MTKDEATKLTTKELIETFGLYQPSELTRSGFVYKPVLGATRLPNGITRDDFLAVVKPRKQEVLDFLKAEREAEAKAAAERQAKIDAIPGLKKIQNAQADLAAWREEFNRSFDSRYGAGVGGMGVRPKPKYDIPAMLEKYPVAAAYLKAEAESMKEIIADPEHYEDALARMDAKQKEFVNEHIWD